MNYLAKSLSRFSLLLFFLLFFANTLVAQSTRKQLRAGNKFFEKENYREAIPFYEQVLANDPDNAKALYFAGISYMTFDKERSADYLYRVQKLKPNIDRDLSYWLGRTDHINYRFDSAIDNFKRYQKEIPRRNEDRRQEVAQLIQHAQNAKKSCSQSQRCICEKYGWYYKYSLLRA